jgi:hypothetical protein
MARLVLNLILFFLQEFENFNIINNYLAVIGIYDGQSKLHRIPTLL